MEKKLQQDALVQCDRRRNSFEINPARTTVIYGTRLALAGRVRIRLVLTMVAMAALFRVTVPAAPEFPFQFRDGLICVEVRVAESTGALNFLLDSGAGVSVINLRTAKKLGLKTPKRM